MFQRMRNAASDTLVKIHQHPFNQQLHAGTLPRKYFEEYVRHDVRYLAELHKALTITANRITDEHHANRLHLLANKTLRSEQTFLAKYLSQQPQRFFAPPALNPVIEAYTSHLLTHARLKPIEVSLSAILACLATYGELGLAMAHTPVSTSHPYRNWINSYAKNEFIHSVRVMVDSVEHLGANSSYQPEMIGAFLQSVEFELQFWQSVYPEEKPAANNTLSLAV
jgi:thiaminase (transcriptional activator TenA)